MLLKHYLKASVAAVLVASTTFVFAEDDVLRFKVQGTNPGGKGGYTGEVSVTKTKSKQSALIRWVTGSNKAVTEGIAIRTDGAIGAGYGGKSFYALAVYHLDRNVIHGTWALSTTPEDVGSYDLKGSDYDGKCKFADGSPGTVTFTEGKDGAYKVAWDLPTGHFDGIGLRIKDTLVAASGDVNAGFGVVALEPKGDEISGLWTTAGSGGVGKETWTLASDQKMPNKGGAIGNGKTVEFGGETYVLKDQKSAPGQPTSELREYLREGEDWDGYRKMIAFRMQLPNSGASAADLADGLVAQTKKSFPDAYTKLLESTKESATLFLILVKGDDVEMDLWNMHRTAGGVASAQFVLRNKPPYDTQKKFKAEQDKNYDQWNEEIKKLGALADKYIAATAADTADAPPSAPKKDSEMSPALVEAIKADLQKCSGIARNFMSLLQDGKTSQAVKLLGESAFKKMSREDFAAEIEKSNKKLGPLQNFTPDKDATDFGMKNSVMTFTLQADAQYEHAKVRETLRFIRNSSGEIEFVDYNRAPKE